MQENNWKLCGIVNGIDYEEWSPQKDKFIVTEGYTQYGEQDYLAGKAANKAALQRELGLPEIADAPLLGFIGRMDYQKGVDLITESFDWIMGEGAQLVMLGSGRPDLEDSLRWMEGARRDQCRCATPFAFRACAALPNCQELSSVLSPPPCGDFDAHASGPSGSSFFYFSSLCCLKCVAVQSVFWCPCRRECM